MPYYAKTGRSRPPNRLTLQITLFVFHGLDIGYLEPDYIPSVREHLNYILSWDAPTIYLVEVRECWDQVDDQAVVDHLPSRGTTPTIYYLVEARECWD